MKKTIISQSLKFRFQFSPKFAFLLLCLISFNFSFGQYMQMDDFQEVGAGNFFLHLENESEVKQTIKQVVKNNKFPFDELVFSKGNNLYFAAYYPNPEDKRYTYFIHAEKVREGYDLYMLYIENTYHYFYDYHEGPNKFRLIYDPEKEKNNMLTSITGEQSEE